MDVSARVGEHTVGYSNMFSTLVGKPRTVSVTDCAAFLRLDVLVTAEYSFPTVLVTVPSIACLEKANLR
jgi:hypothetical protein